MKSMKDQYDVIILGGGLAGLTLTRQLLLANSDLQILTLERRESFAPEAAFKVGESTVEIGAHYIGEKLQLANYMKARHLPKAGLRFFFSNQDNADISARVEFGAIDFPPTPSYQVDRGRFENDLCEMIIASGSTYINDAKVQKVILSEDQQEPHQVEFILQEQTMQVKARWVVDASGRAAILKKQLKLQKDVDHKINSSWFRLNREINVSEWQSTQSTEAQQSAWREKIPDQIRHLSTCHLMGEGYWVWLIPLASKSTSIGIVADQSIHPHADIFTFEKCLLWLQQHEPQLAAIVTQHQAHKMDFRTLKNYAHDVKQVFSAKRWAITGEAGAFVDPFYSPGSDCIAMSNDFIADLILKDFQGEAIAERAMRHNFLYLRIIESFFQIYQQQYPLMGNPNVMLTKIVWDYASYWAGVSTLFFANKLTDMDFMKSVLREFGQLAGLNAEVQAYFRLWASKPQPNIQATFLDTLGLSCLERLNRELLELNKSNHSDEFIHEKLSNNLLLLNNMASIIKESIDNNQNLLPYELDKRLNADAVTE